MSGDSSDYDMVKNIYKQGHEIASHTLSHRNPTTWWAYAGYENWEHEIVGMRERLHEKSGVPVKEITGMRAPFLQVKCFTLVMLNTLVGKCEVTKYDNKKRAQTIERYDSKP